MFLLFVAGLVAPTATPTQQDASPPNVLLVLADHALRQRSARL